MDSQILRLLIFSLLVTVSLCLVTPLAEFKGPLPAYPTAQVLAPFNFNGYPGSALIEIQAVSSVIVCVSPFAFLSSNLATNCPNPIYFHYNSPSPVNEFLLFLDDFSMNFLGQDAQNQIKRPQEFDIAPYTPQNVTISLLQNTDYYISLSLAEDIGNNETLSQVEDFVLTNQFSQCGPKTVPDLSYNGTGEACPKVKSALNETVSSSPVLLVNNQQPLIISFEVEQFSFSAQLDFHVIETEYNFTIYFGFEYAPTTTNFDFKYSNSSEAALLTESDFLGEIVQSFSVIIPNPKSGTYYALVTSNLPTANTSFNVEFNSSLCNLAANDCGTYNVTTYLSSDMNVTNVTFTDTVQYLAVVGESVIFGIDVNNSGVAFVQMDINALPSGQPQSSGYQYNVSNTLTLGIQGSSDTDNFVFGLLNADAFSQDSFSALVWTGSICPGNCSSRGDCNATTTLCSCKSGYKGRYCETKSSSKKKLSTLYIILIIIGGAILLAILIGVPVALFLNNRKKARYERV